MASSDTSALIKITAKMQSLEQSDALLREVATTMLAETRERIHEEGKNAAGANIGTYKKSYLEWRMENGYKVTGSNVKLFLTGQMQNDYKVVPQSKTKYGLGFSNSFNADKAGWAEEKYGKIYGLTPDEKQMVQDICDEFIANLFK
jgi:phage gpG-like protein